MDSTQTSRSRTVLAAHRLVLRSVRTPLRHPWVWAYRGFARAVTAYVTWGERKAATYVCGGVAEGDFLPGLSDVDTAVVVAHDPAGCRSLDERVWRRWLRISRRFPLAELVVERPMAYEEAALDALAGTSALTYGLARPEGPGPFRAAYFGEHATFDWLRLIERPGLDGVAADWRLLRGPDRRPPRPPQDDQLRRIAAWLELLSWWRWVFPVCIDPSGPRTSALCVKLIAEPVRIWLWLAHGERTSGRAEALQAGLRRIPEEESMLRRAVDLHRSLRFGPDPPLTEVLPGLVRMSTRIAELLNASVAPAGATEVRLAWGDPSELILAAGRWRPADWPGGGGDHPALAPLVDWRGLACPLLADEAFALLPGDPGDPAVLGAAARSQDAGPYPALRAGELMVLPAGPWWRTRLRAVKCRVTDPVVFALAAGERIAPFPNLRGWSAQDTARRAVQEHRVWLEGAPGAWAAAGSFDLDGPGMAMLFTAARAALFLESFADGDPEIPLTVSETARRLGERSPSAQAIVEDALAEYRKFAVDRRQPVRRTAGALRRLVLDLPAYAGPHLLADSIRRAPTVSPGSGP